MKELKLFRGNPYLGAARRASRKLVYSIAGAKAALALTVLACVPVGFIAAMGMAFGAPARDWTVVILYVMIGSSMFIVPPLFFNSVAGERERGSWELLRVAPVTTRQVLVGKFMAGLTLLIPWLAFGGICVLAGLLSFGPVETFENWRQITPGAIFLGLLILFVSCLSSAAVTMFLSCRMTKPFSVLMASFGVTALMYMVVPGLAMLSGGDAAFMMETIGSINPLVAFGQLISPSVLETSDLQILIFIIFHLVLIIGLLTWSAVTLDYADRNLRFLPKKKDS